MGPEGASAIILDTGALIAIESGHRQIRAMLDLAELRKLPIYVPTPVIAEAWRGGPGKQTQLSIFLKDGIRQGFVRIVDLDYSTALQVGALWATVQGGHASATDVMVAWCVRNFDGVVLSSDPEDFRLGKLHGYFPLYLGGNLLLDWGVLTSRSQRDEQQGE